MTPEQEYALRELARRGLGRSQRAAIALLQHPQESDHRLGELVEVGHTTIRNLRTVANHDRRDGTEHVAQIARGEISLSQVLGYYGHKLTGGGGKRDRERVIKYGGYDTFVAEVYPLKLYLDRWRPKGFRFPHVNPRQAANRLRLVEQLIEDLEKVRDDLEPRTEKYINRVPAEKRRTDG